MTRCEFDLFVSQCDSFEGGHRPGIIRLNFAGFNHTNIYLMDDPIKQLEQLRDECQRQIDLIKILETQPPQTESIHGGEPLTT